MSAGRGDGQDDRGVLGERRFAGATVEDVRLMKQTVAGRAKVKASGGIRDWKTTLAMLEAGADRIGTSASLKILEEWKASGR